LPELFPADLLGAGADAFVGLRKLRAMPASL